MASHNSDPRLAGLLDSALDAIISVDHSQRVVIYNRAAERIFGWLAEEMIGQPLQRLLPERFRRSHADSIRRFGTTGATMRRMGASRVVYGLRKTGEEFPAEASISHVVTSEGRLFTVILRDVTERHESDQEQMRLAARLSGLLESAMDGIISMDSNQRIVLYNRAAESIFGWRAVQVLGRPLDMLMPRRFRFNHWEQVRRFGETGITSRRMGSNKLIYGLRANGEEFPIDASISQLDLPEGRLYTVILRDVTERVRSQNEWAAFAADASGVREQEQARIARELHDELAQLLFALKMDVSWLREHLSPVPETARVRFDSMLGMLDEAVASTRRIAEDLRPLVLEDLGLVPGIEWLVQTFSQRTGAACSLKMEEGLELQEPYASAVFRVVQESLNNVAKHANATRVEVCMQREGHMLVLSVQDNGVGFLVTAARKPRSLGLVGLRERVHLLQGEVTVSSEPGKGTRIEASIPAFGNGGDS